jgi:hypothetical protein
LIPLALVGFLGWVLTRTSALQSLERDGLVRREVQPWELIAIVRQETPRIRK